MPGKVGEEAMGKEGQIGEGEQVKHPVCVPEAQAPLAASS